MSTKSRLESHRRSSLWKALTVSRLAIYRAPVAQLVEHRAVTREVVSSTPAGPTLRVFK